MINKKSLFTVFAALAIAACLSMTSFGTTVAIARATVPFGFDASNASMAAGQYDIRRDLGSQFIYLTDEKGVTRSFLSSNIGNPNVATRARLVFERTAAGYRLSQVYLGEGGGYAIQGPKSTPMTVAQAEQPERIEIALAIR